MDIVLSVGCILGGLAGLLFSFYLGLCFIQWVGDVIENKSWRFWK
jgi:hypothetical protein